MTSKQAQSASEGSTAIQAAGDVNYSAGISPSQMVEIIDSVQRLVQVYTEQSKDIIEQRLQTFRQGIIEEFSTNGNGKPEAFCDPDFQGALLDAQKSIARSGDEALGEVLIDLVSQKSRCEKRDRLSLTLNDAISKAASLTSEDFDLLALIFIFKNLQLGAVPDVESLIRRLMIFGSFQDAAEGELALGYLESHGCVRTTAGGVITFSGGYEILQQRYPGSLTRGVSEGQMLTVFPESSPLWSPDSDLLKPSPIDDNLLIIVPGDSEMIDTIFERSGFAERPGAGYINLAKQSMMEIEEFYSLADPIYPEIRSTISKYDNSGARDATLTSLGIALAHAHLSRTEDFKAPLSIWIK